MTRRGFLVAAPLLLKALLPAPSAPMFVTRSDLAALTEARRRAAVRQRLRAAGFIGEPHETDYRAAGIAP